MVTDSVSTYCVLVFKANGFNKYAVGSFDVDAVVIVGDIDHLYVNPAVVGDPPHTETNEFELTLRAVKRFTVRTGGPSTVTDGASPGSTITVLLP